MATDPARVFSTYGRPSAISNQFEARAERPVSRESQTLEMNMNRKLKSFALAATLLLSTTSGAFAQSVLDSTPSQAPVPTGAPAPNEIPSLEPVEGAPAPTPAAATAFAPAGAPAGHAPAEPASLSGIPAIPAATVPSDQIQPLASPRNRALMNSIDIGLIRDLQPRVEEVRPETVSLLKDKINLDKTPENVALARDWDQRASKDFKEGRFHEALVKWQEAYALGIEMNEPKTQGRALVGMCRVYLNQGKWLKAKHLGENAVELLSACNEEDDLGRARIALARAYFGLDNPKWAVQQLDAAMGHLVNRPDGDPEECSTLMRLAGAMLLQVGKPVDAMRFFQQAASYLEKANNLPDALTLRTKLSTLMAESGFLVASLEEATKALEVAKRANDERAMISALAAVANAQYVLGEFSNSNKSYEEAYKIASKLDETILSKDAKANLLMGYAFSLIGTGDTTKSAAMLSNILPFFERKGAYYATAECFNAQGVMHVADGNTYKAVPLFERALDAQGMIRPAQPTLQAMILTNIGCAEYRIGKYRDAYSHLRAVRPIVEKKDTFKLNRYRLYVSLAETCKRLADPVNAKKYIEVAIFGAKALADDEALWRAYTVLAEMQASEKQTDKAKESLLAALSHFRSPQAGFFPSAEYLGFTSSRRTAAIALISMLAAHGMTDKALIAAEQLKEEHFINTWQRRGADMKPDDKDGYEDLVKMRAHLHAVETALTPNALTNEWKIWLTRFSTMAREKKSLARLVAPYPTTIEEVIRLVRQKGVTVVDYLVGEKTSVAFTIDPLGRVSARVLPVGDDQLAKQVAEVLAGLDGNQTADVSPAERAVLQALYTELLPQSVRNFLPQTADKLVVIIPDSVLFNLPFAALVDETGKYLIEGKLVSLAPSIRAILDSPKPPTNNLSVLVASDANQGAFEYGQISSVMQPAPVAAFSTNTSNLEMLQKEAQGKGTVHLSTSIPLNDEGSMNCKLPFVPTSAAVKDTKTSELFGLTIPTDLVVLSGTALANKNVQGGAVQVISRGLSYAGARNVMMSLWNLPQDSRMTELVTFYKNKKAGMNDAQSLRQAQLLAMSRNRSPRSWAAFQLLGPGM